MRHSSLSILMLAALTAPLQAAKLDLRGIDQALRGEGTWIEAEKVYRLTFPRRDVEITLAGVALPPPSSWAAFKSGNQQPAIMMGEIILLDDDVNRALAAATDAGIEVTSLHHRFVGEDPRVYFMHIGGEGTAKALADGVRKILDAVKPAQSSTPAQPDASPAKPRDDFVVPREVTMPCACKAGAGMGVNTSASFYGTDENAVVFGQFACTYGQLQPTLKSLRRHGVTVTAVANHMEAEAPRMIFVHYQASGRAADLARAVEATIEAQKQKSGSHSDHAHHH